jgi:hypothetical protein
VDTTSALVGHQVSHSPKDLSRIMRFGGRAIPLADRNRSSWHEMVRALPLIGESSQGRWPRLRALPSSSEFMRPTSSISLSSPGFSSIHRQFPNYSVLGGALCESSWGRGRFYGITRLGSRLYRHNPQDSGIGPSLYAISSLSIRLFIR